VSSQLVVVYHLLWAPYFLLYVGILLASWYMLGMHRHDVYYNTMVEHEEQVRTLLLSLSLRSIILFASIDVSRYILMIDTSILVKSNMSRRE
jgi:hypothetical protein